MHPWEKFKHIRRKFASIEVGAVETLARQLRDGMENRVADEFYLGLDNVVFTVTFVDGVEWICRVRLQRSEHSQTFQSTAAIRSSVAAMRYVKKYTTIPVPTIYSYSPYPLQGLGSGYIMMERMPGSKIDSVAFGPPWTDDDEQTQIYEQLAEVTCQLWHHRFPMIGPLYESKEGNFYIGPFVEESGVERGPFATAVSFFEYKASMIRKAYHKWLQQPDRSADQIQNAEKLCSLFSRTAVRLSEHNYAPFPFTHSVLGIHNALFVRDMSSGKLKLSAILDWDSAHASAWEDFGQFPTVLGINWQALESGDYSSDSLDNLRRQQKLYMDGIQRVEPSNVSGPRLSEIIDSPAVRIAEFYLLYSRPELEIDHRIFLKYIREWERNARKVTE